MLAFGNNELDALPLIKTVMYHHCKLCNKRHKIKQAKNENELDCGLYYYKCKRKAYLCGINGKDIRENLKSRKI